LIGGSFKITPKTEANIRWDQNTWLSKIRFCNFPLSMAITTVRWVVFKGVNTFSGRFFKDKALFWQFLTQTPQPRHRLSSILILFFFGFCGSLAETRVKASTGHARLVDQKEGLDLLQLAWENNLVQFGENNREGVNFICNCCSCCCEAMIAAQKFGFLQPVHTSNFLIQSNSEA